MQQFIASCGGDADTIGAMAGAIWRAANGSASLPSQWLERLEQRKRLCELGNSLHRQVLGLKATKPDSPAEGFT
jgi:ADP-ribosylglycohydrolase